MTRLLLAGGVVFDGTGAHPGEADVTIEGGRFVEIGRGLDGDERIDLKGKALLPGLFDCHTHVTVSSIDMMRNLQTPFSYRFFKAAQNLAATLRIGITTARRWWCGPRRQAGRGRRGNPWTAAPDQPVDDQPDRRSLALAGWHPARR